MRTLREMMEQLHALPIGATLKVEPDEIELIRHLPEVFAPPRQQPQPREGAD